MITNDVQYRSTKAHLAKFEDALANLRTDAAKKPTKLQQLEIDAVAAQAGDLQAEIEEYERLASGEVSTFEATSLAGLATLLIKARIARGWTQARLAGELGVAEQQIQRYEATEYRSASLARVCDVAAVLGIDVTETGAPLDRTATADSSAVAIRPCTSTVPCLPRAIFTAPWRSLAGHPGSRFWPLTSGFAAFPLVSGLVGSCFASRGSWVRVPSAPP